MELKFEDVVHFNKKVVMDYIKKNNLTLSEFCKICDVPEENMRLLLNDEIGWKYHSKFESLLLCAEGVSDVLNIEVCDLLIWNF